MTWYLSDDYWYPSDDWYLGDICLLVSFLAIIHLILSVGNITTTLKVVVDKLRTDRRQQLTTKYRFNSHEKKDS